MGKRYAIARKLSAPWATGSVLAAVKALQGMGRRGDDELDAELDRMLGG